MQDYTAFDNQYDGLACYLTEDSHFSQLFLHDNLAAGISLDLDFDHNTIDGAVLTGNDLGIFMRQSKNNIFAGLKIQKCRHHGVFMAQTVAATRSGWELSPGTACTGNSFDNLSIIGCGGKAFLVNNDSCTNNVISGGQFCDNAEGGLFDGPAHTVAVRALVQRDNNPPATAIPAAIGVLGVRASRPDIKN